MLLLQSARVCGCGRGSQECKDLGKQILNKLQQKRTAALNQRLCMVVSLMASRRVAEDYEPLTTGRDQMEHVNSLL